MRRGRCSGIESVTRKRFLMVLAAVLIAALALIQVTITGPRVTVRWRADISPSDRAALEQQYDLRNGLPDEGATWRYELRDRSRENISALVHDPAAADTGYIDRTNLTAPELEVRVTMRPLPFPLSSDNRFEDPWQLFQLQSLWLLLSGGGLLLVARAGGERRRRSLTIGTLLMVGVLAYAFPIDPPLLRMGDANTYTGSRSNFEAYAGVREVRFEAHLSHAILGWLYRLVDDPTEEAPERALRTLMRGATAWFVLSALGIGFVERWSPVVVRYLGLALLAPSALLYFGYRELGHLSLNVAAFPLLLRGLRDGSRRLEAGSLLSGLGAALHGFGLLSLVGAWIAALTTRARLVDRVGRALRIAAWGTAVYLGWIAVYAIILKLPIVPGHADSIPWRPWLVDDISDRASRVNAAILTTTGGRDLLFTAWVVGAPLLAVAASFWRQYGDDVRTALWYSLPSVIFTVLFWPIQGVGVEMDLVFAAFPALYALTWVCAHDARRTKIAAWLLVSAHLAFWRIVLDTRFVNFRLD